MVVAADEDILNLTKDVIPTGFMSYLASYFRVSTDFKVKILHHYSSTISPFSKTVFLLRCFRSIIMEKEFENVDFINRCLIS